MSPIRETWSAMTVGSRLGAIALGVAAVAVVGGLLGGAAIYSGVFATPTIDPEAEVEPTAVPPGTSLPPLAPTPTPDPSATPSPTPSPTPVGADPVLGTDGRLTVLLLGSDYRPAHPGNRTDAIMVVSVDPIDREDRRVQRPPRREPVPVARRWQVRPEDQRALPVLPVERPGRRRDDGEGLLQGVRDRDRRVRLHRLRRREASRRRRRRRGRHAGQGLLRRALLGEQPPPGLGPAEGQEPPQREPGADLRPHRARATTTSVARAASRSWSGPR